VGLFYTKIYTLIQNIFSRMLGFRINWGIFMNIQEIKMRIV